jgi:hypothetical protein
MDHKMLITLLTERVCVPEFCVGSPSYGAQKYVLSECDVTIIKQRNWVPVGTPFNKFGLKTKGGGCWSSYYVCHTECVAQLDRLESYKSKQAVYMRDQFTQNGYNTQPLRPDQVTWVGDTQVLQDVILYMSLIHT